MENESTILVVEDSITQALQIQYLLELKGYKVPIANDAAKALEIIEEKVPDLIISDIMMPEMNGFELCKIFKEKHQDVPFILLTHLSSPEDIINGIQCKADSFIVKPFDDNYLITRTTELLENFKLRKNDSSVPGKSFEVFFRGNYYNIEAGKNQIFDLMISTFDSAFHQNKELKKAQNEIRAVNEELERQNEELQKAKDELSKTNLELEYQKNELLRSNEALQKFTTVISHDLTEPLRGVNQFTKLLSRRYKGQIDEKGDEYIQFITDGTERMQNMISSLLDYAKVGYYKRNLSSHNTENILSKVKENLTTLIMEKNAVITNDKLPELQVDSALVSQLFQNIILNAIKYNHSETPKVHVSAENNNGQWIFSIKDNGIGIDKRDFDKIFNLFQRLHTQNEYKGVGVGLSLCKEIVERHNGKIWLESEIGQGTTFFFTLSD